MAQPSREKPVRGTARVAFIAHLDSITAELGLGHTALAVYQRHQAKLGGSISYQQFARYVRQLREDGVVKSPLGRPALSSPRPAARATPAPAPLPPAPKPQPAPATPPEGPANARHEPAARPTFKHHGVTQEGEPEQLLGPGFLPKRRR